MAQQIYASRFPYGQRVLRGFHAGRDSLLPFFKGEEINGWTHLDPLEEIPSTLRFSLSWPMGRASLKG